MQALPIRHIPYWPVFSASSGLRYVCEQQEFSNKSKLIELAAHSFSTDFPQG